MPQGLHEIDSSIPADYWEQYQAVISAFSGILHATIKQVHHIQLAPNGVSMTTAQKEGAWYPGKVFEFKVVEQAIIAGEFDVTKEMPVFFQFSVDLQEFDETKPHEHPVFRRMAEQGLDRRFTFRELEHIWSNEFKHSEGRKEAVKRKELALLSGRNPDSMRSVARTIKDNKLDSMLKVMEYYTRSPQGTRSNYSHTYVGPPYATHKILKISEIVQPEIKNEHESI